MRVSWFLPRAIAAALVLAFSLPALSAAPTNFSASAGEVRDFVAVSATTGYAATVGGGLWKTTDAGNTWSKLSLPARTVNKVSANPANTARLYAATETGLYRSTDSGGSWTRLTQDAAAAVAVSPGSSASVDTVLFSVRGAGIYKTSDSGATITRASGGLNATDVIGIVFAPGSANNAYAIMNCNYDDLRYDPNPFEGPWGGVWSTANAGASWTNINGNLETGGSSQPCPSSIVAVGTAGAPIIAVGIKRPDDQGNSYTLSGVNTWTASASNPFGVTFLGPDITTTSGIFRGTVQFGLQRSTNGNASYADVTTAGNDPDFVTRAGAAGAFTATTWVANMNGIGMFRTTTGFGPWSLPATPIKADRANDIANHNGTAPGTYYMALENGSVMKSTNGGSTWAQFFDGLDIGHGIDGANYVRNAKVVGAHPNNVAVAGVGMRPFGLYQLNGAGTGWTGVSGFNNAVDHKPQSLVITPAGRVYYSLFDALNGATPGGLYSGTATANTLGTLTSEGVPNFQFAPSVVAPGAYRVRLGASPETRAYLLVYDGHPYRTNDGGGSWARVGTSALNTGFHGHAFLDVAEKAGGVVVVAATNKGIYRSVDGGANFTGVATSGLPESALAAMVYHGTTLIGGTFGGQLYCSVDDGVNWAAVTGGNLGASIKEMKFINGAVHVLTDGAGLFKKDATCP